MSDTEGIKKAYNEWAEIYDRNKNTTRDLNAQVMRLKSLPLDNKAVLEIGCGTGLNTSFIAERAKKVVGLDFSESMIGKARTRVENQNVTFKIGDVTQAWAFKNSSFDFIIANLVLEHVKDLTHIFNEAYRVLNRKGKFYIAELHPYKQLNQSQAKYISKETGKEVLVEAFIHPTSEYINEGIKGGFALQKLTEHKNEGDSIPRLITLLFEKQ